jgi:hypothetical protein
MDALERLPRRMFHIKVNRCARGGHRKTLVTIAPPMVMASKPTR